MASLYIPATLLTGCVTGQNDLFLPNNNYSVSNTNTCIEYLKCVSRNGWSKLLEYDSSS